VKPELIQSEVFAEVPARLRKSGTPPERLAAGKSATPAGSFLEGPAFERARNLVRMGVYLQLSGGRGPDGLAADETGGLAVAHPDMGAVWIFSHRGEPLYRVNSCRSDLVTNVAYLGNEIYITDSGSGCVLRAKVPTRGRTLFSHL
jgi:hypothetical protein